MLREALEAAAGRGFKTTLARAEAERRARNELRSLQSEIERNEAALREHNMKIDEQIKKTSASRKSSAVFPCQVRAVELIDIHDCFNPASDHVAGPAGSTMTTCELQKQLRAEDFRVGDRELRRFMRQCGVKGQRGKRTDLQ